MTTPADLPWYRDPRVVGPLVMATGVIGYCAGAHPLASLFAVGCGLIATVYGVLSPPASLAERKAESLPAPKAEGPSPQAPIAFETLRREHARRAVALIRPYPPHREPCGRSRIGGVPDLPPGVPWPRVPATKHTPAGPLHFLAQVDLTELPWAPDGFPRIGTLLFFARIDETMDWVGSNPVRVVWDRASEGAPTEPPDDLGPLEDGYNEVDRAFGREGRGTTTYPAWPLRPVAIDTMPDGDAFVSNSYHHPAYASYSTALMQFRADQIQDATGIRPAGRDGEMPIWRAGERGARLLRPHAETGFPWVAGAVVWIARALGRYGLDEPARTALAGWRAKAEALAPAAPWPAEDGQALVDEFNALIGRTSEPVRQNHLAHAVDGALRQVVTRTGGDPALAAAVPDALYEAVRYFHTPILRTRPIDSSEERPSWTRDDYQDVQVHQMFGHVPSTQAPMPITGTKVCLIQFQSDRGLGMILCDMGEADFWLEPEDLRAMRFERVVGETRGG